MKKRSLVLRDIFITCLILALCFGASVLMQDVFAIPEQVTTAFAFAVFLISLFTDGYVYGLAASLISVVLVNYAFTFPYFSLNFIIPSNLFSALVMAVISFLTSMLTTQVKHQEAVKAERETERMRANLLRAVSHDLRTPLTTIYGSSTALLENEAQMTPQQRSKMLRGIQEDSQWLVRMVENLLSITRFDSGNVQITLLPTALDELVDSVVVKFRKYHPEQKIQLELPGELVMIPMDPLLIEQLLINILENAVHHGIGMTELVLRVCVRSGTAIFEVIDNGCGIAPEKLPQLFTGCMTSSEKPADNAKRNVGIGLSVCATIIRAHGGTISANNRKDGGAVFRFTLSTEETDDE